MHSSKMTIEHDFKGDILLSFYDEFQVQCLGVHRVVLNTGDEETRKDIHEQPLQVGDTCAIVEHARGEGHPEHGRRFLVWLWVRQSNGGNFCVTHWTTEKVIDERKEVADAAANDSGS